MKQPTAREIKGAKLTAAVLEVVRAFPEMRDRSFAEWRKQFPEALCVFAECAYDTIQEVARMIRG